MKELFELRGALDKKTLTVIEITGLFSLLALWTVISVFKLLPPAIFPSPWDVITSFK